ncbi:hypothetical protein ACWGI0_08305 [Streptomyces sp. NPDC054802]
MTHLSIRVLKYNAETKEMREVSSWSKKVEELPNQPLMDARWPMCECWKCKGNGTKGEMAPRSQRR